MTIEKIARILVWKIRARPTVIELPFQKWWHYYIPLYSSSFGHTAGVRVMQPYDPKNPIYKWTVIAPRITLSILAPESTRLTLLSPPVELRKVPISDTGHLFTLGKRLIIVKNPHAGCPTTPFPLGLSGDRRHSRAFMSKPLMPVGGGGDGTGSSKQHAGREALKKECFQNPGEARESRHGREGTAPRKRLLLMNVGQPSPASTQSSFHCLRSGGREQPARKRTRRQEQVMCIAQVWSTLYALDWTILQREACASHTQPYILRHSNLW